MKITLRKKKNPKNTSLYIDFYHKGKRKAEYLGLTLISNPQNAYERAQNRKNMEIAEYIYAKRVLEFQHKEFGIKNMQASDHNFIQYFQLLCDARYNSRGNYGTWIGAFRHLKEFAGSKLRFNEITSEWLEEFKLYLTAKAVKLNGEPLLPNTISSYYGKIRTTLKQAVKDGYIEKSPANQVKAPKPVDTQREFLTLEEVQQAAKTSCDIPILKAAFLFSVMTGLRFSDIEKMRWSDLEYSQNLGHYIRFKQQKTQSQETQPISDEAYHLLGQQGSPDEVVFTGLEYSAYNNDKLRKWIKTAGINKYITFHCARHTYATLQLSLGTDIYTVSKLLGHKHLQTTEIYANIIDKNKIEAANRINLGLTDL